MAPVTENQALVTVSLPYFVTQALKELPRFLDAIGSAAPLFTHESLQYWPDAKELAHDPEKGKVVFNYGGGYAITFFFLYRPGCEGTRGSLDRIEMVEVKRRPGEKVLFAYLEHHCFCPICPGLKHPFCPVDAGIKTDAFEKMGEADRLTLIRRHVEKVKRK